MHSYSLGKCKRGGGGMRLQKRGLDHRGKRGGGGS